MSADRSGWFSFSSPGSTALRCAACGRDIDAGRGADHHPGCCPKCGVESAFLNWKDRTLQVVPNNAPPAFVLALRFAQDHLDELEYVELICALEEMADALKPTTVHT